MQCRYCQNWNEEDERRCVRCGRRLHLASPRSAPEGYPSGMGLATATAPALESFPGGQPLAAAPPERTNYQASLFRDAAYRDGVPGPKVVPIPMLTPSRPPAPRNPDAVARRVRRPYPAIRGVVRIRSSRWIFTARRRIGWWAPRFTQSSIATLRWHCRRTA